MNKSKTKNTNRVLGTMFLVIVLVYIFFFTSNFTLGGETLKAGTKLNTPISFENCNVTIENWKYSKEQQLMEIELDIDRLTYSNVIKYDFIGYQKDKTTYSVDRIVDDKDYLVLHIDPVPQDFKEFTIQFTLQEDDSENSILNLHTNANEVENVDVIETLTKKEYIEAKVKRTLKHYNNEISNVRKDIEKNNQLIEKLQVQITEIEEKKKYYTAEELDEANQQIADINSTIEDYNKLIEEDNAQIEEFQAKIQKSELKLTDLQGGV